MQSQFVEGYPALLSKVLKFTLICVLSLGIVFRFANLDLKPYWLDEAFTSLRLAGYTNTEVTQQIENRILTVKDLQKFQQPAPEKTVFDTIEQISTQEPQLTPFYFVMLRAWVQLFGSSIATIRSLSVVFSLLAFPCLYWLCLELFSSRRIAWMAIALVAVSPIHLIYAQEARPLSLWIVTTLASSALLLRARRKQTKMSWVMYAVGIAIGLYSHLFTAFLSIGHGIFLLLQERFRLSRTVRAFSLASIAAWVMFLPWMIQLVTNRHMMTEQSQDAPLKELVKGWIRGISLVFVDFSLNESSPRLYFLMFLGVLLSVLIFVGATMFFFCRSAPRETKLFILTTIAVPFILLIPSDLVTDASRSAVSRYFLSAYLGIQLAVAYVLMMRIMNSGRYQKVWVALTGFVLSIGLISCGLMAQSEFWWNKAESNAEWQLAQVVNRSTNPIILVNDFFVKFLSFSHALEPRVHVQFLPESSAPEIPQGFSDVFLYRSSEQVQREFEAKYDLQPIQPPLLWKVKQ